MRNGELSCRLRWLLPWRNAAARRGGMSGCRSFVADVAITAFVGMLENVAPRRAEAAIRSWSAAAVLSLTLGFQSIAS